MKIDSYADTGSFVAVDLVNAPVLDLEALRVILAVDPPSLTQLRRADEPAFAALAARLREVFADLRGGAVDSAAARLNALLLQHPAHPHLAKEDGVWRLHHHPAEVGSSRCGPPSAPRPSPGSSAPARPTAWAPAPPATGSSST